jgi:hypothetical protein
MPEWEQAIKQFVLPVGTIVGQIDCRGSGLELCKQHGVMVFPNVKFGDPNNLQIFSGKKKSQEIMQLLSQVPKTCSPSNLKACKESERTIIKTFQDMQQWELKSLISDCTYEPTVDGLWRRDTTFAFASYPGEKMFPNTDQECSRKCRDLPDCMSWAMSREKDKAPSCQLLGAMDRSKMHVWDGRSEGIEGTSARKEDPTSTMFAGNKNAHLAYGYLRAVHAHREHNANDEL